MPVRSGRPSAPRLSHPRSGCLRLPLFCLALAMVCPAVAQRTSVTFALPDSNGGAANLTCAALNPITGKLYVGGLYGNAVVAVDGAAGTRAARIPVDSSVSAICVNTVNNKVYAACWLGTHVTIVDGSDDRVIANLPVASWPRALSYSPGSNKVYCVGTDTLYVIDGATDRITKRMQFSSLWTKSCYDSRRDRIFWGQYAEAGYLLVLDCATDSVADTIHLESMVTTDMCYEPLTDRVYGGQSRTVNIVDAAADSVIGVSSFLPDAAVSSDGARDRVYCAGAYYQTLHILDGRTAATIDTVAVHLTVTDVCYLPGVDKVYCGGRAGVSVVDATTGVLTASIALGGDYVTLVPDHERNRVFCFRDLSDDVVIVDAVRDSVVATVPVGARPGAMCWNPLRQRFYVASDSGSSVSVIDPSTCRVEAAVKVGNAVHDLCYVPETDRVYCANGGFTFLLDTTVSIIDCATNVETRRLYAGLGPRALCYVPSHGEVYCLNDQGFLSVIDVEAESVVCWIPADPDACAMCYNPVHNKVYWYSLRGALGVMDAATHSRLGYILRDMSPRDFCFCVPQDRLYVLDGSGLLVVSGQTDSVVARPAVYGSDWVAIACTPEGDRVYCLDWGIPPEPGQLVTLDGFADTVISVVTMPPWSLLDVAYDAAARRVYVADVRRKCVLEFDRDGTAITETIPAGPWPWRILVPAPGGGMLAANKRGSSATWVKPLAGIECQGSAPPRSVASGVTVVRASSVASVVPAGSMLLDATGRRTSAPGGITGLVRPGVYFVSNTAAPCRKLLVVP